MKKMKIYPTYYRRYLPHFQFAETTLAVTYRLYGSIPQNLIKQFQEEYEIEQKRLRESIENAKDLDDALADLHRKNYLKYDKYLDGNPNGPYHLANPEIAQTVIDSLFYFEKNGIWAISAYCIMSNHVHLLVTMMPGAPSLTAVMEQHKSYTGLACNRILGLKGSFWALGSYDHWVRTERSFANNLNYTLQNPVKAGLVAHWEDWQFSYCNPKLLEE